MTKLTDNQLLEEIKLRFNNQKQALDKLESLNNELTSLNKRLEESEKLKTHFLSNIRNEIINPFTSILGLSRNILKLGGSDIEKIHNLSKMIYSEAATLDFQLQNIFAAAELEAGTVSPRIVAVNMPNLCNSVLNIILANLLSNSIKFSSKNSEVYFNVKKLKDALEIRIVDEGIGIDKDSINTIFDRFKRLDDAINTLNTGHGLGLSIVYAYLDLLGGTIDVQSDVNKGSEFIITIQEPSDMNNIHDVIALDNNEFLFDSDGEVF